MTIAIILLFTLLTLVLGRGMFGSWFNHVGLYGITWGLSLALFHVGLIYYYPLEPETWMVIVGAWAAFLLGSAVVVGARYAMMRDRQDVSDPLIGMPPMELPMLHRILWIVNIITLADAVYEVQNVARLLGGASNLLKLGNLLYSLRTQEGIPGAVPYVGTLTMTGSLLAGYYTSKVGRLRLVAVAAIMSAILISTASMVRATLVMAAILFITGYMVERKIGTHPSIGWGGMQWKRILSVLVVIALILSGMEIIRGNRGMTEGFAGESAPLRKLSVAAGSFITPSIFMYMTVHHGVLNQYLQKDSEDNPVGRYSFAPLWRILSKIGFETYVPQHAQFYRVPVPANTGTYLRDLHSDFGLSGVVFVPFILGLLSSVYWFRFKRTNRLVDLVILGHAYVGVGMSLFAFVGQMGVWLGSLIFGLIISFLSPSLTRRMSETEGPIPL